MVIAVVILGAATAWLALWVYDLDQLLNLAGERICRLEKKVLERQLSPQQEESVP